MERSLALFNSMGRFGMIIPMSSISTRKMTAIRELLMSELSPIHLSNYSGDAHPSTLFSGVKMRLSIVIGRQRNSNSNASATFTTMFMRWYAQARPFVFALIAYHSFDQHLRFNGYIPKISSSTDATILQKVMSVQKTLSDYMSPHSTHCIYAHRIVAHFVKCFDFVPFFRNERDGKKKSEDYKVFCFRHQNDASLANAVVNSNTFYYTYLAYSDAYHCGRDLIEAFPLRLDQLSESQSCGLTGRNRRLMDDMKENSVRRRIKYRSTGWIEYDEFYAKLSKTHIDELDAILASAYGLTEHEVDHIVNYDIKYRLGPDTGEDDENPKA